MADSKSQIADGEELAGDCEAEVVDREVQAAEGELAMGEAAGVAERRSGEVAGETGG